MRITVLHNGPLFSAYKFKPICIFMKSRSNKFRPLYFFFLNKKGACGDRHSLTFPLVVTKVSSKNYTFYTKQGSKLHVFTMINPHIIFLGFLYSKKCNFDFYSKNVTKMHFFVVNENLFFF